MAYNKKQHYRDNIQAIRAAFFLDKNPLLQRTSRAYKMCMEDLQRYSGFGGLKCVLYDSLAPKDWPPYEHELIPLQEEFFNLLRQNSSTEEQYKHYLDSIRSSVLSAFYTPPVLTTALSEAIAQSGIKVDSILEPSAGNGAFTGVFNEKFNPKESLAIEKDILTGKILHHRYASDKQTVLIQGFENLPSKYENHFDLVVSNIPFGDFRVFDPNLMNSAERKLAQGAIHNYFFVKGLDACKDGGLLAFVTSQGVANSPANQPVRKYLMENANLISMLRLPNNLFTENAGTKVGTDLIILQKNSEKKELSQNEKLFTESIKIDGLTNSNAYLSQGDFAVCTMSYWDTDPYGKLSKINLYENDFALLKQDIKARLSEDFSRNFVAVAAPEPKKITLTAVQDALSETDLLKNGLPKQIVQTQPFKSGKQQIKNEFQLNLFDDFFSGQQTAQNSDIPGRQKILKLQNEYLFSQKIFPHYREGSLAKMEINGHGKVIGTLSRLEQGTVTFSPLQTLSHRDFSILDRYIDLRDTAEALYHTEARNLSENKPLRQQLNKLYDGFVKDFGYIQKNRAIIKTDSTYLSVLSLEKTENDEIRKTDIFFEPTAFDSKGVEKANSSHDALLRSLNGHGYANLDYMQKILPSQDIQKTVDELVKSNMLYLDPTVKDRHVYVTGDKFLRGNIYRKIDDVLAEYEKMPEGREKGYVRKGLRDLEKSIPQKIEFDDIGLQLGERWLPCSLYERFAKELFQLETNAYVQYRESIDEYTVGDMQSSSFGIITDAGRKNLRAGDLFKHALEGTEPYITKTGYDADGKAVTVPDFEKQQLANIKITEIQERFAEYLLKLLPQEKEVLQNEYNRRFNAYAKPVFDGSHQTFPNLRLDRLPNVKELYAAQKNAIWMLKQNGGGIIDHEVGAGKTLTMCITAYEMKRTGQCNLPLIIGLKANTQEIAETFRTIYPDAKVCYPSEKDFDRQSRGRFFNDIKNNNWDVVIMTHDNFLKIQQDPEIEQEILKKKLENLNDGYNFGEEDGMSKRELFGLQKRIENTEAKLQQKQFLIKQKKDGVLTVDFSSLGFDHIFVDESHRFKNLSFETKHDRVAGLGKTEGSQRCDELLTAIRTIQKKKGTDLCATFLSGTTIANSISELYNLFTYLRPQEMNMQGVASFDAWVGTYAKKTKDFEFTVTGEIKAKERFRYFVKVPELAMFYNEITDYKTAEDIAIDRPEKNETLISLKPSEDVRQYSKSLIEFAKTGNTSSIGLPPLSKSQDNARMLIATTLSKKASLDMRLIDFEKYGDDPLNKATQVAKNIAQYYKKFDEHKGTQFVFSDLSTWQNDGDWNIYAEIKRKLEQDYNIAENEIAFIQKASNNRKRAEIIQSMNEGKIRVLFGSTETLGTGVNAQQRAVAIHHLDIPWRPCDLQQRNGRGIRAANRLAKEFNDNKVDVFIYAVEQTLDAYKFNLLQNKQRFIDQLKRGQTGSRTIDEGAMDESTGMNFAEYVAILSGNTDLLEKTKLERKIGVLESERKIFYQDITRQQTQLKEMENETEKYKNFIHAFEKDWEKLQNTTGELRKDEKGNIVPKITFADGLTTEDPIVIAEKINKYRETANTGMGSEKIGEFCGFEIRVKTENVASKKTDGGIFSSETENLFSVHGHTPLSNGLPVIYSFNHGRIATNPELCAAYALNALNKIPTLIDNYGHKLGDAGEKTKSIRESISAIGDWKKQDELIALKSQHQQLEQKIAKELNKEQGIVDEMPTDRKTKLRLSA